MTTDTLDLSVFNDAADLIEQRGWTATWYDTMLDDDYSCLCVWTAVSHALSVRGFDNWIAGLQSPYADRLCEALGVQGIAQVFVLNDDQPVETGKQWAIDTLRGIATS